MFLKQNSNSDQNSQKNIKILNFPTGIKQSSECGDLEIGIGLAVFGKETRLIQEATNDYELVVELLGNIILI